MGDASRVGLGEVLELEFVCMRIRVGIVGVSVI